MDEIDDAGELVGVPGDGLQVTQISLPLLVRDWLKERCKNHCFVVQEYNDVKWDQKRGIYECNISTLIATPNRVTHAFVAHPVDWTLDVSITNCQLTTWKKAESKSSYQAISTHLNWKDPSLFRKLGRAIKCHCKTLKKNKKTPASLF